MKLRSISFSSPARAPIWSAEVAASKFYGLTEDLRVDVAVIGGGITGVTAAAQLARAGKTVALIEAHTIGAGTRGHATGNLYATVDQRLHQLAHKWGRDRARQVIDSRSAELALIERNVTEYRLT